MRASLFKENAIPGKRFHPVLLGIAGGFIFWGMYVLFISRIPSNFYEARDDAVITLSHAKNLVEYGTIGINPAGERIEGFSSPVQFILYWIAYEIYPFSYREFLTLQVITFIFLLGFFFILFFKEKTLWALFFTMWSGFLLFSSLKFTEWTGSGMENSITSFFFLLSLYVLFEMYKKGKIYLSASFILFLSSITRAESIYFIFPLLIVFVGIWKAKFKNIRKPLIFSGLVLLFWLIFKGLEFLYFGSFFPNTAEAQSINLVLRLKELFLLDPNLLNTSAHLGWEILKEFKFILILLVLPFLLLARKEKEGFFLLASVGLLSLLSFLHPFLFGPARLDRVRTNTQIAPLIVLLFSFVLFSLKGKARLWIPLLFFLSLYPIFRTHRKPVCLCCSTERFERLRTEVLKEALREKIPRPTLANVDLGAISWHKDFNILDLGKLGSPVISRLKNPVVLKDYIFEFAAPDFIALQDWWSCFYHYIFTDSRFQEMYEPKRARRNSWFFFNCRNYLAPKTGLWIRKDIKRDSLSKERKFLDKLTGSNLNLRIITEELRKCKKYRGKVISCEYVTRNVYRFLPEFVKQGKHKALLSIFKTTKTSEYDLALLNSRNTGNWYKKIIEFLYAYEIKKIAKPQNLWVKSKFNVYIKGNKLMLISKNCHHLKKRGKFLVEIKPCEGVYVKNKRMDFSWGNRGFKVENKCIILVQLPTAKFSSMRIIQENEEGKKFWAIRLHSKKCFR